jgi:hypothetical protein
VPVVTWTQADIDSLKTAIAGGVLEVEFDGPPRRRIKYQDLSAMRKLLAEMVSAVAGDSTPTRRLAKTTKGFR